MLIPLTLTNGMRFYVNSSACQPRHAGALGTACTALIGLGIFDSYEEAAKKMQFERSFSPQAENRACYDRSFEIYQMLYPTLKPIFVERGK